MFEKDMRIAALIDIYGSLLTDRKREIIDMYYNDDYSLSEISENTGISRQGVRDSIKRAEQQLYDMEEKLGLAAKFGELKKNLGEIIDCADKIYEYNLDHSLSREINDNITKIKSIAEFLSE